MFDKVIVRGLLACALAVVFTATTLTGTAKAALIAYDGFAYPAGSSLIGQNGGQGFSDAWYQGGFNVSQSVNSLVNGSPTYSSLATTGNQVAIPSSSALNGLTRDLAGPIASGTIYVSCLLTPEGTLDQGNALGFFGVTLHGNLDDAYFGKANVNGTDFYDVEERGGGVRSPTTNQPVIGKTEFLVLKAQLVTSGNDIFTLYADPTPGGAEPASGAVLNSISIGSLSSLVLYSGGAFNIDELRVGTTYADVTPGGSAWAAAVSGSWSIAGNWTGPVPNGISMGTVINAPTTVPLTITLDAPQTLGSLVLGNSAVAGTGYALTGAGGNTLTLNNAGGGVTITVTNGTHAINAPLLLNDNLTVIDNGSLSVGGPISNGSNGPMGINVSSGLLTLAHGNTFSGNTTISGGSLTLADPLAVQNSTVNLTNSGAMNFAAGNTAPILGGLTGAGNVALVTATAQPVMLSVGQNGQSTTFSGSLGGAGGLTKLGAGILALTTTQNYSGPTVVNGGVLQLQPASSAAAGSGVGIHFVGISSAVSGSAGVVPLSNWNNESGFTFNGNSLVNSAGQNSGVTFSVNGANSDWATGSSNQVLNGYIAVSGVSPMTLTLSNIPYSRYSIYTYVGDSSTGYQEEATINGVNYYYATEGALATYAPITSTNPSSYQSGNYIEVDGLTGSSQAVRIVGTTQTFGGLCSVEIVNTAPAGSGGSGGVLPALTALSIAASSTLDLSGGSQQVASLSDFGPSGGSIINGIFGSNSLLTISASGGSTTFSGAIQGGGGSGTISLLMSGSGRQVLSGTNTYTGPTTVSQGKLVVDGWLANSAVSVNGGNLGGSGHLSSVTVNPGGTLAPGDSQGVMNLSGNLTLFSGAAMDYELDGISTDDEVSLPSGTLFLNNQKFSDFNFTPLSGFGPGTYDLIAFGSSSGSLGAITSGPIGTYTGTVAVEGNDLVLTVVPEPSTVVLLAAGVMGLIGWARRERLTSAGSAFMERTNV